MQTKTILPLSSVGLKDIELAGGKNASLGEMLQHLVPLGVNVPDGFVITVQAFRQFLVENNLPVAIKDRLAGIDYESVESLRRAGLQVRSMIRNARFPKDLSEAIIQAFILLTNWPEKPE